MSQKRPYATSKILRDLTKCVLRTGSWMPRFKNSIPASRTTTCQVLVSKICTKCQPDGLAFLFLLLCWSPIGVAGSDLWKVDV